VPCCAAVDGVNSIYRDILKVNMEEDVAALEQLVFEADQACKRIHEKTTTSEHENSLQHAETSLMRLQYMLGYLKASSESEAWHTRALMSHCLSRLQHIRIQASRTDPRCVTK